MTDEPQMTEAMRRAEPKLLKALIANKSPFDIATTLTACWRHSIGDDVGAAHGLHEHASELWHLIERVVEFYHAAERSREAIVHHVATRLAETEANAFTLAANQCAEGYSDEYGNHRCRIADRLREAEREIQRLREVADLERDESGDKKAPVEAEAKE